MKKLIILLLAACIIAAMAGCGSNDAAEPTPTVEPTPTATPQPVDFIVTGPKASVGTAVGALSDVYMADTGQNIQWKRNTENVAIAYLATGDTDIALITREIKEEETDVYGVLDKTLLCTEAIAIIVGTDCPLDDISIAQLQQIYSGEVIDWADFGGSGAIAAYGMSNSGSSGDAFEMLVLGRDENGAQVTLDDSVCNTVDTVDAMVTVIAGNPLAIGFMPLAQADGYNTLKMLSVEGTASSEDTVQDGTYPLQRPFYMVTASDASEMVQAFIDYCTTDDVSKQYLEELGYILP